MTEVLKSLPDWKDQATTSKENLKRSLDDLWERYLDLLDQYQTSRNDLNKTLASVTNHMKICIAVAFSHMIRDISHWHTRISRLLIVFIMAKTFMMSGCRLLFKRTSVYFLKLLFLVLRIVTALS